MSLDHSIVSATDIFMVEKSVIEAAAYKMSTLNNRVDPLIAENLSELQDGSRSKNLDILSTSNEKLKRF